jgi:hypothetical protein
MRLICIYGNSGSGKSFLNRKFNSLSNIVSYDSDDIVSKCFFEEYDGSKETKTFWNKVSKRCDKVWKELYIKAEKQKKDIFVICGNQSLPSFITEKPVTWFWIKVTDYPLAYKRRINRDFEKVCENRKKIEKYITNETHHNIMTLVNHGLMINTEFPQYSNWLENEKYLVSLKREVNKKKGKEYWKIRTTDEIYESVINESK